MPRQPKGVTAYWIADTSGLDFVDKTAPEIVNQSVQETLEDIAQDIRRSWSDNAPSAPGQPPATVTGYLDSSIQILRQDGLGRFASVSNAIRWSIRVGAEYALALEFGNPVTGAAPRPFLTPAVNRATDTLAQKIATGFKTFDTVGASGKTAFLARRGRG